MSRPYDLIVVGGGIVGLATALQLLKKNQTARVLLLEKEGKLAAHQTGNNSGVIHSGIYYKPDGLKAKNCIKGYNLLLEFCKEHGVAHEICGKIIVATNEAELPRLETLYQRGQENGLTGLEKIGPERIKEIEPHCTGIQGIRVPQTGIVDFKGMCEAMGNSIRKAGGDIHLGEKVVGVHSAGSTTRVVTSLAEYETKCLVSCAGLHSDRLARMTQPDLPLRITPFRGEYYELRPASHHLVKHLIYPVPDPAFPFLGVHFTRMIHGGIEAGPNAVLAFGREAYKKTDLNIPDFLETLLWPGFQKVALKYWKMGAGEFHRSWWKPAFVRALQKLIPQIESHDLMPGGAGIRAQACHRDGSLLDDFHIVENGNIVHVCNAPSPAATACLAIGEHISDVLLKKVG